MSASLKRPASSVAEYLAVLAPAARLDILLAIGRSEVCVCHLESVLQMRQALLSQHLMALRKAGVITSRRDGRFIFYRVTDARVLDLIQKAAALSGDPAPIPDGSERVLEACPCPRCRAGKQAAPAAPEPGRKKESVRRRRDPLSGVVP